jgi:hypothetical protein
MELEVYIQTLEEFYNSTISILDSHRRDYARRDADVLNVGAGRGAKSVDETVESEEIYMYYCPTDGCDSSAILPTKLAFHISRDKHKQRSTGLAGEPKSSLHILTINIIIIIASLSCINPSTFPRKPSPSSWIPTSRNCVK